MTINQMQYFSTVCLYCNITTSARLLSISQPALSASLADLEKEVGCKLLDRTSKGVQPTTAGKQLLRHVNSMLSRYRMMEQDIPNIAQSQNIIRVGFRPYSGETPMLHLYSDFRQKYSDIKFVFHEMRDVIPYLFLEDDQVDFISTTERLLPEEWGKKYGACPLEDAMEVKIYCHVLNPLAKLDKIGLKDLDNCPIAFWEGHQAMLERFLVSMGNQGYHANHIATFHQLSGIANLICNNVAVGVLAGDFILDNPILHGCTLKEELKPIFFRKDPIPVWLVWKKSTERYDVQRKFIEFARAWRRGNA